MPESMRRKRDKRLADPRALFRMYGMPRRPSPVLRQPALFGPDDCERTVAAAGPSLLKHKRLTLKRRKRIAFGWYGGKYSHLDWLLPLLPDARQ